MRGTGRTTRRGLGWDHQQDRQDLLDELLAAGGTASCPLDYCDHAPMLHPSTCPNPPDDTDGKCFYCRLERDHVTPRALGGTSGPARLTHSWCNRKRGAALRAELRKQTSTEASPTPTAQEW